MTFDKNYPNRKDRRSPYYKSGKHDRTCRPGGGCPYCEGNRLHRLEVQEEDVKHQLDEFKQNPDPNS